MSIRELVKQTGSRCCGISLGSRVSPCLESDVPTTPAVGTVVAHDVTKDDAGNSVILALDPTPTRQEATTAKQEGWEVVPENDPLRSEVPGVAPAGE